MAEAPTPRDTIQELEETLADARADLELARADLGQAAGEQLKGLISEEIDALLEEIAILEGELQGATTNDLHF